MLWKISERRITKLCNEGRIHGAIKFGWSWAIPANSKKPSDGRSKSRNIKTTCNQEHNESPVIERVWAMPNKNTFSIKPIRELIISELDGGLWIDPFANSNRLATITNDLNPMYDTDYHLDALDFLKLFKDGSVDGVLYDPPYSPRQVSECYNDVGYNVTWDTTKASFWSNHKKEISRILRQGGKVITFGWNSGGIGKTYGFYKTRILLVPHGGWHNDTICTVEIKMGKMIMKEKAMKKENRKENNTDRSLIDWIEKLPIDFWDFKDDDTKALTHGFHTYPATMIYPISRNIINKMKELQEIHSLLDPFSGSGTVPVEALLAGVETIYANDLNPLALFLNKVKTTPISEQVIVENFEILKYRLDGCFEKNKNNFLSIDEYMNSNGIDITSAKGWGDNAPEILRDALLQIGLDISIPTFKNLGYWFKPTVIIKIQMVKDIITEISDEKFKDFALLALSETIRLVSNRRNSEFKMYRLEKNKVLLFNPDVLNVFYGIINNNIKNMVLFNSQISGDSTVYVCSDDSRNLTSVPDNSIDLLITSPPYGDSRTTVAYGEFSKLSLQWLGINSDAIPDANKIDSSLMGGEKYNNGFIFNLSSQTLRESLDIISSSDIKRAGDVFSFYEDLDLCLRSAAKKSKIDTYQFWVVGNRTVKKEYLQTDKILVELGKKHGLEHVTTFTRKIHNKVMPSSNSPSNIKGEKVTTMTNEFIVIFRKENSQGS